MGLIGLGAELELQLGSPLIDLVDQKGSVRL